jgi:branched-chain amino acid transport system permease protein
MTLVLQALIDGILIGGVYAAIGIGLSLAYGVMGVVNWAHGEMLMVSLYISYYLTRFAGFDPYLTILINFVVLGTVGFLMQKFIFNKLVNRGGKAWMNILLFTAGLGLALQALASIFFGAEVKSVITRYAGMLRIGDVLVSVPKLISFTIAIAATALLFFFIQRSETGRAIRATAQDRNTAQLMGINSNYVFCVSFALSLALVGISGSLLIPFYSVYPYIGSTFTFKSFIIVALGGRGNIPGALIGGLLVGMIEKLGGVFFNDNIAQILIFVLFIVILLVRPNGLLSKKNG